MNESDMKPYSLTESPLTHYREEGFVVVPEFFTENRDSKDEALINEKR